MNRLQIIKRLKETFPVASKFTISKEAADSFEISFITGNRGCTPPSNNAERRNIQALFDKIGIKIATTRQGHGFMSYTECKAVIQDRQIPEFFAEIEQLLNNEIVSENSASPEMM